MLSSMVNSSGAIQMAMTRYTVAIISLEQMTEWALGRHVREGMRGRSDAVDDINSTNMKIGSGQG